jgi:large subunit ribosomal protein L30e
MELSKELRQAVSTGNVAIGTARSIKALKRGEAKLVIKSSHCPQGVTADIGHYSKLTGVPVHVFAGDSGELGLACGKPFMVSVVAVIEPGNSSILSAVERK